MPETTELAVHEAPGLDRMRSKPIIDRVDARTLALIKAQVAKGCDNAEVGYFLELAAHYDLDPFAREVWCAKDKKGRLLIMVGRDGLRKIAQRQGLSLDGDVVHEKDEFRVQRTEHGRVIHHAYGLPSERGPIVGAWCQATDAHGSEHGYFFALLSEYKPNGVSEYSPWSKQTSVMILAAAERQACRQATPLSGLLVEGEDESANAIGTGTGDGSEPGWGDTNEDAVRKVEEVIARAQALGHSLGDRATAQMQLSGQDVVVAMSWCANAMAELDAFEQRKRDRDAEAEGRSIAELDADREAMAKVAGVPFAGGTPAPPSMPEDPTPRFPATAEEHQAVEDELGRLLDELAAAEDEDNDDEIYRLRREIEERERLLGQDEPIEGQETMGL